MERYMKFSIRTVIFLFLTLSGNVLIAQESERSSIIETIDGKEYYIHLLQPGQTLEDIEKIYGISTMEIIESTPSLEKKQDLRPNQILRIPVSQVSSAEPHKRQPDKSQDSLNQILNNERKEERVDSQRENESGNKFTYHKVKEGETLFSISQRYNLTVNQVKRVNPGLTTDLKVGQTITIPQQLAEKNKDKQIEDEGTFKGNRFNAYTVKEGETIYRIAKNFGISQKRLLSMNPRISTNNLEIGSRIRIPVEGGNVEDQEQASQLAQNSEAQTETEKISGVPEKEERQDTIKTYRFYKVKFLERVPGIAKRQNIEMDTIYKLNPGIKQEGVNWGDVIKLPREAEVKSAVYEKDTPEDLPSDTTINFIIHRVVKDETLYRISKLYDVPQKSIVELNPGADKQIEKGQRLKIPVERKERKKEEIVEKEEEEDKEKDVFKEKCLQQSGMDKHFEIAVMVPLYLDNYQEVDTSEFHFNRPKGLKSLNFIQFYEGALLALDTLEKQGLKSDIYVYDVGRSREEALDKIDMRLQNVDLIIGPIYSEPFEVISGFADEHDIRIVNPLSTRESIIQQNENVFKVQAPEAAEMKAMGEYINKHYPDTTDIYVVRDNKYVEKKNLEILKSKLINDSSYFFKPKRRIVDMKYVTDSLNPMLREVDTINKKRKMVVALTHNKVFTIELLRHLNEARDSIGGLTVFGKSAWRDYGLNTEYLMNLDVHLFDDSYIDYEEKNVKWFLKHFRNKYRTEPLPEKYAFAGYDIVYYFGSALMRFGEEFEPCLKYHQPDTLEINMSFQKTGSGSFENVYSVPLRYYNYKLINLN